MITDSNQACLAKMTGCGGRNPYFEGKKGEAKFWKFLTSFFGIE